MREQEADLTHDSLNAVCCNCCILQKHLSIPTTEVHTCVPNHNRLGPRSQRHYNNSQIFCVTPTLTM